jgi:pre-mRNA-splicing factor ATP-dependent RNA helicase DHX15/PRP43
MSFQIRADGIMDPEGRYPNPLTGQPYSKAYRYMAMEKRKEDGRQDGWVQFATWRDRIDIIKKIHKSNILLVKIPPGTGKTVIIPKLLLHYFGYQRPVLCTGPKQITVQKSAEFAAKCLDVPYNAMDDKGGDLKNPANSDVYPTGLRIVGYKHGAEKNMSNASTKLLFTTDGWVKENIIRSDADLSKFGGVIVDEVHERSVNIDIVIALLMDIIKRRPDFKVIFVSATMDLDLFEDYMKRINLGSAYSVYT